MRLKTIYELANEIAPFALSGEYCQKYGAHDNSGIQLDCGEVTKILFSLDLSSKAIARAKETGADCIFTHHPAIFNPLYSLTEEGAGRYILDCAQSHISVISAHLNLDCAKGGIDDCLMHGLGGKAAKCVMHSLTEGGYGKIFEIAEQPFGQFENAVKKEFSAVRAISYGAKPVKRVASFCGAGTDGETVAFALSNGADTFVSSDPKHHLIAELVEKGLNVVILTHYAAENYGFFRFYQTLKNKLNVACEYFTDERYL